MSRSKYDLVYFNSPSLNPSRQGRENANRNPSHRGREDANPPPLKKGEETDIRQIIGFMGILQPFVDLQVVRFYLLVQKRLKRQT
jgi:hypothetical protein